MYVFKLLLLLTGNDYRLYRALRCALNRGLETSTEDLHKKAALLRIHLRSEEYILNFVYDVAQDITNHKLKSKFSIKTRSSNKILLKVKCSQTETFKCSLAYIGPNKWNTLPAKFHHTQSKSTYKSMVRNWVILKAISNVYSFVEVTT